MCPVMDIEKFLQIMVEKEASDLYFKVGNFPYLRVEGRITPISEAKISPQNMENILNQVVDEKQKEYFQKNRELDLAYSSAALGRFRVNLFRSKEQIGMVIRQVKRVIPTFEELNLPSEILQELSLEPRGLILVTGPAGCGKSTTLAAMIEHINQSRETHIVTIEDPIEFLHEDKKSVINQREVGIDTLSFSAALRHVVRQSPDVILIGEMRDRPTVEAAVMAAETGHLVFSTLHTIDAPRSIERILNFFPPHYQGQLRVQLAYILKAVISMRLLPSTEQERRIPAVAVMVSTPTIRKLIVQGKLDDITSAMEEGKIFGMQSFTQSLLELYNEGKVSYEDAVQMSDSPQEFSLKAKGLERGSRDNFG